jgi:hypothetical protein
MKLTFDRNQIALAAISALTATSLGLPTSDAQAQAGGAAGKVAGTYAAGDFHNHTTCSDGSISVQKLVGKSTGKSDGTYGLDWFVQAGHGGNGNRNCTLIEDASLATPAYPYVAGQGPDTTWANSIGAAAVKGNIGGTGTNRNDPLNTLANPSMWRWQSIQEYQYPVAEYLTLAKGVPTFMGMESVVAGHEHTSMSVITGQLPAALDGRTPPTSPGYTPLGNATALAQWSYCFDRGDTDTSRGGAQNWSCAVSGSLNEADPSWYAPAAKLIPASGTGAGVRGHAKTVDGIKWMAQNHPTGSYYVPAHLERAGPFNPDGNNGFNIEHLRNLNNAGPDVAFGFETQPGHHASDNRGEYRPKRNNIGGVLVDSVGGTTWGGTGVYGAQIGGVWDALLGEGRRFWFFASSDWHNRGSFSADDRRSTQDFLPGEYQRNYTMVRTGADKIRPQTIVDGLRSGNNFADSGQLIDRLAFFACTGGGTLTEVLALKAAKLNTDTNLGKCVTMGEKLVVRPGQDITVTIALRDPQGSNYSPYTFDNPSLKQIGISQPLDKPVLDHVDVINGRVTGYKTPGAPGYAGQWPNGWIDNPNMDTVPEAAKNLSAKVIKTFNATSWTNAGDGYRVMSFRIPAVDKSQYVRLRGSNLPAAVPFETDANGNPLADLHTNANDPSLLKIPCTTVGSTEFNGCPSHMATFNGQKYVSYDVAAWADLWFYSNPIYIEVKGSTVVAGVK